VTDLHTHSRHTFALGGVRLARAHPSVKWRGRDHIDLIREVYLVLDHIQKPSLTRKTVENWNFFQNKRKTKLRAFISMVTKKRKQQKQIQTKHTYLAQHKIQSPFNVKRQK
jgi:hypothetical protein